MSGLQRVLHRPVSTVPVVIPDRARGERAVQSSSVPQWNRERDLWEWWYKGFTTYTDEYLSLYATSVDGVHWDTQDVGSNNVAYVSNSANLCHVIRDDLDADPRRRYKGLFSDGEHMDRYPGVSADDFQWEISQGPPIPSQDTSTLVYDDMGNRWSAGECRAPPGDQLAGEIGWIEGRHAAFGARPLRLRFHLHRASLYSFWLA